MDRSPADHSRRSFFSLGSSLGFSPLPPSSSSLSVFVFASFPAFPLAISQTSRTPLELSEIGPEEERPCSGSREKREERVEKGRTKGDARAERRRKVIFWPRRFRSTCFSSGSVLPGPGPRAFSHAKTFLPYRIPGKGSAQIAGMTRRSPTWRSESR